MNPLWTENDIAAAIGTTAAKVRKLVASDDLPVIRVPKVGNRFDPVEVDRWLRDRTSNNEQRGGGT